MDMASLFSIDTDQLESAFQFDPGKLDLDLSGAFDLSDGSVDFSSLIDPDSFQFDLAETPGRTCSPTWTFPSPPTRCSSWPRR